MLLVHVFTSVFSIKVEGNIGLKTKVLRRLIQNCICDFCMIEENKLLYTIIHLKAPVL